MIRGSLKTKSNRRRWWTVTVTDSSRARWAAFKLAKKDLRPERHGRSNSAKSRSASRAARTPALSAGVIARNDSHWNVSRDNFRPARWARKSGMHAMPVVKANLPTLSQIANLVFFPGRDRRIAPTSRSAWSRMSLSASSSRSSGRMVLNARWICFNCS